MMNLLLKKASAFLLILLSVISYAQTVPPPPENPESGDIGAPSSPIDAYTSILFVIALAIIVIAVIKQRQRILE